MAIGNPISLTDNVASKVIRVLATNNQTVFTVIGGYRINQLGVFRNGVRLSNNSDFVALDGVTVTLVNAAQTDDEVLFQIQDDFKVADAIVSSASTQTINGDLTVTGNFYYGGGGAGILTTGGDGSNLTGVVNSLIAGDNISVSSATGNVTITGLANTSIINSDSLNVIGITTVTTFNATTGSFSGNVSIGGTLTYEDVSNVDSVGLITARSGIHVGPTSGIGITLNPNGNITAASHIEAGDIQRNTPNGLGIGAYVFPASNSATLQINNHETTVGASCLQIRSTTGGSGSAFNLVTNFGNDGSAVFKGQVDSRAMSIVSDAVTTAGTSYFACSDSVGGYSSKIIFYSGGSATFTGTITAGGYSMASLTQL